MEQTSMMLAPAARIKEARLERGWSQEELAFHAGMTREGIKYLENSSRAPNYKTMMKLIIAPFSRAREANQPPNLPRLF